MNNYILRCEHCGKMFKAIEQQATNKGPVYITDYGDRLQDNTNCIICGKETKYTVQVTADWIADLVFTIKGK